MPTHSATRSLSRWVHLYASFRWYLLLTHAENRCRQLLLSVRRNEVCFCDAADETIATPGAILDEQQHASSGKTKRNRRHNFDWEQRTKKKYIARKVNARAFVSRIQFLLCRMLSHRDLYFYLAQTWRASPGQRCSVFGSAYFLPLSPSLVAYFSLFPFGPTSLRRFCFVARNLYVLCVRTPDGCSYWMDWSRKRPKKKEKIIKLMNDWCFDSTFFHHFRSFFLLAPAQRCRYNSIFFFFCLDKVSSRVNCALAMIFRFLHHLFHSFTCSDLHYSMWRVRAHLMPLICPYRIHSIVMWHVRLPSLTSRYVNSTDFHLLLAFTVRIISIKNKFPMYLVRLNTIHVIIVTWSHWSPALVLRFYLLVNSASLTLPPLSLPSPTPQPPSLSLYQSSIRFIPIPDFPFFVCRTNARVPKTEGGTRSNSSVVQ